MEVNEFNMVELCSNMRFKMADQGSHRNLGVRVKTTCSKMVGRVRVAKEYGS